MLLRWASPPAYGAAAAVLNLAAAAALALLAAGAAGAGAGAGAGARPLVLVALGDSLTQGYGLPEEEGLVPRLEAWLRARGHAVRVVNAGVSGDTTAGGLARLEWTLAGGGDALIVALGGNDLLRGIDPRTSRANLRAILLAAAARGVPVLLAGVPVPANYGRDYQRDFAAIWPDLAAEFGTLLVPDLLAPLTARRDEPGALARLMQADGLHPSAAGVALIVEALGPAVEALIDRAGDKAGALGPAVPASVMPVAAPGREGAGVAGRDGEDEEEAEGEATERHGSGLPVAVPRD